MKVILVRHGESVANAINDTERPIFTGQWDCDLTERGLQQAAALREDPLLRNADAYFCSDLRRAMQTAHAMTDHEICFDIRLRERSLGDFEGQATAEIESDPRYASYFSGENAMKFRHDFSAKAPNGESYRDVWDRLSAFWSELSAKPYSTVVIVSHMCAIRCLRCIILGLPEQEALSGEVHKCAPIVLDV